MRPIEIVMMATVVLTNLHFDLQSTWPQEGFIDQIRPVGHSLNKVGFNNENKAKSMNKRCNKRKSMIIYMQIDLTGSSHQ